MSKVISIWCRDPQVERLARRLNRTPSETAALLLDEALRMAEYSHIVFRDSAAGRQAYLAGTGLAVWEIVWLAEAYAGDVVQVAEHLEISPILIQAALNYAADFADEIATAIEDNASYDQARLARMLPQLEVFKASVPSPDVLT
jgi:uncharacterized protein (DUF433 family)